MSLHVLLMDVFIYLEVMNIIQRAIYLQYFNFIFQILNITKNSVT